MDKYREQRRFWNRVIAHESGCWLWIGGTRSNGYGMFAVKNGSRWTQTTSHRFAYRSNVGLIPEGFEIDHLCRVRHCVRPDHLEAVSVQENRRRRDSGNVFAIDTNLKPLPVIPDRPATPVKVPGFCRNGHEYAVTGKLSNGISNGKVRYTCAACRMDDRAKARKGNKASDRTHCPQGHPYTGGNLISKIKIKNGRNYNARECRECVRLRNRLASRRRCVNKSA